MRLEELPVEVQAEIKDTLTAYNDVSVVYENGGYHVVAAIGIKSEYAPDHKFIGTYTADEIYTEDEQIINYVKNFHYYPINYHGKRDYKWLKGITEDSNIIFDGDHNLVTAPEPKKYVVKIASF